MGMDITGICQKRTGNGRWETIPGRPRLFKGDRDREYFIFLMGAMNHIDINDEAIDDLIREISFVHNRAELTDSENGFSKPGVLTLSELVDLKEDRNNPSQGIHNQLIHDLTKICGSCDYKDFRIVFVFDN